MILTVALAAALLSQPTLKQAQTRPPSQHTIILGDPDLDTEFVLMNPYRAAIATETSQIMRPAQEQEKIAHQYDAAGH